MSQFDLNAVTAGVSGANDTVFPTCPPGEYPAQVKDVAGRQMPNKNGGMSTIVDITWTIDDQGVREALNLKEPSVRQSLFLDLDEQGQIDMGAQKNVRLGRLREALGLNNPDQPFSFDHLPGQVAIVTVTNTPAKDDPDTIYANVQKVAPLG